MKNRHPECFVILLAALFFFTPFFLTSQAHAQNMVGELDEKFHLEKSISERLEQTLKTRLEKKYFDITVEAKLKRKTSAVSGRSRQAPSDISNSEEIQKWYSGEINQISRQMKNAGADSARPFELDSLVVTLGLSDQVNAKYNEDLRLWLQQWVQSSFGSKGEAQVITRPSNIITPLTEEPHGPWRWNDIGRFQNLLGMLFLGVAFFLGKFFQSRSKEMPPKLVSPVADADDGEQKELLRNLKIKIAMVSPAIKNHMNDLITQWCDKESQSYLKVAALFEALGEGGSALTAMGSFTMPSLPTQAHLYLPKALANLQELELSLQVSLYQEIYRDLLTGEPIDKEPRHIDFEFISGWSEDELKEVFATLSEPCQVSLLARLPQAMRRRYSQIADPEHLRHILQCSLIKREATDEELLRELQTWQNKKQGPLLSDSNMALKLSKLREVWSVFSTVEESLWMHQVATLYPEAKEILSRDSAPLAFLPDWSAETIRRLCLATKSRELAAAAKCLPFLAPSLLQVCGETQRLEIQKEMELLKEPRLNQIFEEFIITYESFVAAEKSHRPQSFRPSVKSAA